MGTESIMPSWYFAESQAKHVRQVVVILPSQAEVPPRVQNLVCSGGFMFTNWAVTVLFRTGDSQESKGPFVFVNASGAVERLRQLPVTVAFAFYRLRMGGVMQVFVSVDSPGVRAKYGYPFLAEYVSWLDEDDDCHVIEELINRDRLEVCFVAPGLYGLLAGDFGLSVELPAECRESLRREWDGLLAYHKEFLVRDFKGSLNQYNTENPIEDTPILEQQGLARHTATQTIAGPKQTAFPGSGGSGYKMASAELDRLGAKLEISGSTYMKICPDCAEKIKIEARVCRYCRRQFTEDEIDATRSAVEKRDGEHRQLAIDSAKRDEAVRLQKMTWDAIVKARSLGRFYLIVASFLVFVAIALTIATVASTIAGLQPEYLSIFIMLMISIVLSVPCIMAGKRKRLLAHQHMREFDNMVTLNGNLIFCPCGRPRTRYYWAYYVLSILLFPWGLISFFFKLKKCRACGRPYPATFM